MKENLKKLLEIFIRNPEKKFTRKELEALMEGIGSRTLLRLLSTLTQDKRIRRVGESSATLYIFSQEYYEQFSEKLYLYQNSICIGYLAFEEGEYFFAYNSDYLVSDRQSVIFEMPLSTTMYTQVSCFVDFEEVLPEGIDRKILIEKSGEATEYMLLKHNNYASNDLIFSSEPMQFSDEPKVGSYLVNKEEILGQNNFPNLYDVTVALEETALFPSEFVSEEEVEKVRTISLSGYQHKIQVILENGTMRNPNEWEEVLYFIKPYHPLKADFQSNYYFPHIAINEHLHMSFAKNELGFDVPETGLFKREGDQEYHYLIKYFDRYRGHKFQRKEFSSYLKLNSENKYKTSSEKLFETAAKVLRHEEDRLRMLGYYLYSFIIRHEDMHTKNISTIQDNGKVFLAPLYDIASTGFYNGIHNYESHLPINGKQTNIRLKDFLILVERAKVSKKQFIGRAAKMLTIYQERMPHYIQQISTLGIVDFYEKERPNVQDKKIKIKRKRPLEEVMMEAFEKRVALLEKNLWFEQLGLNNTQTNF